MTYNLHPIKIFAMLGVFLVTTAA